MIALLVAGSAVFWVGGRVVRGVLDDPEIALLRPEHGAQWIRAYKETGPEGGYGYGNYTATFRIRFKVSTVPENATLTLRAYRACAVYVDGELLGENSDDLAQWKQRFQIDLAPVLSAGDHELQISVWNESGPPLVLAYCDALRLHTGESWEVQSVETDGWITAITAQTPHANTVGAQFRGADRVFVARLPFFAVIFLIVFAWTFMVSRQRDPKHWLRQYTPSASDLRWLILCAWALLALNNILKLPFVAGFDVAGHVEYIQYIARNHRVPFAHEGWVMWQSPLYHLISAGVYVVSKSLMAEPLALITLRIIPMLCGALQVQLCYTASRIVFPDREDSQGLGTLVGGLMPVNIYMSQYIGNEPLAGVFGSLVVVIALGLLRNPNARWTPVTFVLLGGAIGCAMLTKVSTVLLCAPVVSLLLFVAVREKKSANNIFDGFAIIFGTAFMICGWFYVRNIVELGAPVVRGWDAARGFGWWQEPGYRIVEHFTRFGVALSYPIYSSVNSVWDGLYSTLWLDGLIGSRLQTVNFPPWNYGFMLSGAWLALLPTALILIGCAAVFVRPVRASLDGRMFVFACLAIYYAATLYLILRVTGWMPVKAYYTLAVLPCYAILAASGYQLYSRYAVLKAATYGAMSCWALCAYAAYFIVQTS